MCDEPYDEIVVVCKDGFDGERFLVAKVKS